LSSLQLVRAQSVTAASCNTSAVQTAINTATEGQTVNIPAGTCAWTSGVTISGKGIYLNGAGSGRNIAYSSSTLTLGTGSKSLTVGSTRVDGTYPLGPTTGQTLTVSELGNKQNFLTGTVTSFNSGTGALVMNITSNGGTCGTGSSSGSPSNCARWLVSTPCITCITNNSSSTLFSVTEDSTVHTTLENFEIDAGTGAGDDIDINSGGGAAVIVQNMRTAMNANGDIALHFGVNRGVVSNWSCDSTPFSQAPICADPQPFDTAAWETTASWGNQDTNGQHAVYVETSDFDAFLLAFDNDEGAKTVLRYSFFDNAGIGGHGADTGPIGARTIEFYENVGVFNGYSNGKTFPMNQWDYVRGGSFVYWGNTMPAISSTDYGTKDDINMTVMNLQRDAGTTYSACWGHNTSGGADYPAPHQVGFGCTTTGCSTGSGGTGVDGKGNNIYSTNPYGYGNQYVGDSEPAYIWANSRQPLTNVATSDYGNSNSDSCVTMIGGTTDISSNYIQSGRDYFNGSTAKPGYTAEVYPNPLISGVTLYTWTPTISPSGGGTVTGVNSGSGSYASGTTIGPLTATANTGYSLASPIWTAVSGSATCTSSTNPTTSFSLAANSACTANFTVNSYTLSTATNGTGSGTVTGCAGSVNYGAGYSCTATPAGGSTLAAISGCGGSGTTTYTGTMPASNCTVTATFNTSGAVTPAAPTNLIGTVF